MASVTEAEGAVGVLVNNAGYSLSGAIETASPEEVRRQFETNVFGLVRLAQLVLPTMREQGFGKIVNVSSMGGRLTFPEAAITTRPSGRSRRCRTCSDSRSAASEST